MTNTLNKKIEDLVAGRVKKQTGQVGIEIEVEGEGNNIILADMQSQWEIHNDNSLRHGGLEFQLRSPIMADKIQEAIDEFAKLIEGTKIVPSLRTSVHVHVNVLGRTLRSLYSLIMVYWLFENMLVRCHGRLREGNLHCLRLSDAEGIFDFLLKELRQEMPLQFVGKNDYRYAALNLAAINKFGSVEYRFMKLPLDNNDITKWAYALFNFTERAMNTKWDDILNILQMPAQEAIQRYLPELSNEIFSAVPSADNLFREHHDKILLLYNKLREYDKETMKYYGNEDYDNGEEKANTFGDGGALANLIEIQGEGLIRAEDWMQGQMRFAARPGPLLELPPEEEPEFEEEPVEDELEEFFGEDIEPELDAEGNPI